MYFDTFGLWNYQVLPKLLLPVILQLEEFTIRLVGSQNSSSRNHVMLLSNTNDPAMEVAGSRGWKFKRWMTLLLEHAPGINNHTQVQNRIVNWRTILHSSYKYGQLFWFEFQCRSEGIAKAARQCDFLEFHRLLQTVKEKCDVIINPKTKKGTQRLPENASIWLFAWHLCNADERLYKCSLKNLRSDVN